jgi:flagellar hook-length control protein FliK
MQIEALVPVSSEQAATPQGASATAAPVPFGQFLGAAAAAPVPGAPGQGGGSAKLVASASGIALKQAGPKGGSAGGQSAGSSDGSTAAASLLVAPATPIATSFVPAQPLSTAPPQSANPLSPPRDAPLSVGASAVLPASQRLAPLTGGIAASFAIGPAGTAVNGSSPTLAAATPPGPTVGTGGITAPITSAPAAPVPVVPTQASGTTATPLAASGFATTTVVTAPPAIALAAQSTPPAAPPTTLSATPGLVPGGTGALSAPAHPNPSAQAQALASRLNASATGTAASSAPPAPAAASSIADTGSAAPTVAADATPPARTGGAPLPPLAGSVDLTGKIVASIAPSQATHPAAAQPVQGTAAPAKGADPHLVNTPPSPGSADHAAASTPSADAASLNSAIDQAVAPAGPAHDQPVESDAAAAPTATADATSLALQPHAVTGPAAPATAAAEAPATTLAVPLHPAGEQLALNLKRAVKDGVDHIQIELNPPSLGKIEVRLDFAGDGHFNAVISASKPETLHLLQQDSKALEQSLRDAGLQADGGSLSFNLRGGETGAGQQQFAQSSSSYSRVAQSAPDDTASLPLEATAAASARAHDGTLDIHA